MHRVGRDILVFEVGGRRYGLPASSVRELARAVAIIPLPAAPPSVEGVVDFRGRVVPVLNLRFLLGLSAKAIELGDHLIIGEIRKHLIAVRVDRAVELVQYDDALAGSDSPDAQTDHDEARVAKLGEGLSPILDLNRLFPVRDANALASFLPRSWDLSEERQ